MSFSDLLARADQAGEILESAGVQVGAAVYLQASDANWCSYLVAFLGAHLSGRIPVLAPYGQSPMGDLARLAVHTEGAFEATVQRSPGPSEKYQTGHLPHPLDIVFSSGSTGEPKGYLFDVSHFVTPGSARIPKYELRAIHFGIPFCTSTGAHAIAVRHLLGGVTSIHVDSITSWEELDELVDRLSPFELSSTPFAIGLMVEKTVPERPITGPRQFRLYAGPLSDRLAATLQNGIPQCRIVSIFGATEGGVTTLTRSGTGSRFNANDLVRLWNHADARWTEPGEVGEIVMAVSASVGPPLVLGQPSTGLSYPAGWIGTGDLGRLGATGTIDFLGRSSDLIVANGERHSAFAIEQRLEAAGFAGAIAFAASMPDAERLCIALEVKADLDAAYVASVSRVSQCSCVVVVPEFPRTALGKVIRRDLIAGIMEQLGGRTPTSVGDSLEIDLYDLRHTPEVGHPVDSIR